MASEQTAQPKARRRGRGADPEETKSQLVAAAIESLIEEGYRGTTARSIGERAKCNQAAIYYHFGGIEALLVEALKQSSAERLSRYQKALPQADNLQDVVTQNEKLYAEDSAHLALLTELTGGITAAPELRQGIADATAPWLEYVETQIAEVTKDLPFGAMLPQSDLADLVFSIVIGVELRNKIDDSPDRSARLFRLARLAAGLADGASQ